MEQYPSDNFIPQREPNEVTLEYVAEPKPYVAYYVQDRPLPGRKPETAAQEPPAKTRRKRHRGLKIFLICLAAVLALAGGLYAAWWFGLLPDRFYGGDHGDYYDNPDYYYYYGELDESAEPELPVVSADDGVRLVYADGHGDALTIQEIYRRVNPSTVTVVTELPRGASVGTGVFLHKMRFPTRCRETIYADYIFRFHPDFEGLVKRYYDRDGHANIEGGDVLNLTEDTLAIGISQRTSPDAIEEASRNLFADPEAKIRTVLAFDIPSCRAFMHLDTVFTQIDYDKYTIHPAILGPLTVYEITPGVSDPTDLHIRRIDSKLEDILEKYTRTDHVKLINCGGDDLIASAREQWNDGSNTLCVRPGTVVVYQRNNVTNDVLYKNGINCLVMPSAELSRGRGGPRCMSMPAWREAL